MNAPDKLESLFLKFIASFTPENIRDAITQDIDLAELIVEEYSADVLTEARHYARLYDVTHPGRKEQLSSDMSGSAMRVVEWLKASRPDLGFEIASFQAYPTAASLGFSMQGMAVPAMQTEHVGIAWVRKNLQSLSVLLL